MNQRTFFPRRIFPVFFFCHANFQPYHKHFSIAKEARHQTNRLINDKAQAAAVQNSCLCIFQTRMVAIHKLANITAVRYCRCNVHCHYEFKQFGFHHCIEGKRQKERHHPICQPAIVICASPHNMLVSCFEKIFNKSTKTPCNLIKKFTKCWLV